MDNYQVPHDTSADAKTKQAPKGRTRDAPVEQNQRHHKTSFPLSNNNNGAMNLKHCQ